MHESKKRTLNLTPSSGIQTGGKKRLLDGSPHKLAVPFGTNDDEDWQKQFLIQSKELRRLRKLKEFLELEKECNA